MWYYNSGRCATLNNDVTEVVMADLKIGEVILRERRKLKMTQDELARALDVSAQAVSNWERGGYPDITLLPKIANYFRITVDELIGNDEAAIDEDMTAFWKKHQSSKYSKAEKLIFAKEMYVKYPHNFELINELGNLIVENMDRISENIDLLKELHNKIMAVCTDEEYRRTSIHRMCFAATDDKLEDLIGHSELNWQEAIAIGELREERYILQRRYDEFRRERNATDLLIFMQYLGRHNMKYYGENDDPTYIQTFTEPERTVAWEKHKMRLLENLDPSNEVPEAWSGCYAVSSLKAASALIGCGELDEGFSMLNNTFPLYERWLRIPEGAKMNAGNPAIFANARISKVDSKYFCEIFFEDGTSVWTPYLWLFWQNSNDILHAMTNWPWFDSVREDERYIKLLALAKEMAGKK